MKLSDIIEGLENPITGEKQRWADANGHDINPSAAKKEIMASRANTTGKHYEKHIKDWARVLRKHLEKIGVENVKFKDEGEFIAAFSGTKRVATYEIDYREARYTDPKYAIPDEGEAKT